MCSSGLHCLRIHDPNDTGYDARGPYSPDDVDVCLAAGGHIEGMVRDYSLITMANHKFNPEVSVENAEIVGIAPEK